MNDTFSLKIANIFLQKNFFLGIRLVITKFHILSMGMSDVV